MRLVQWTDEHGYIKQAYIRDQDRDEDAQFIGIPHDPPDLNSLDWKEVVRETNNELVNRQLIVWQDVQASQSGVSSAVRRVVTKRILQLYRQETELQETEV